MQLIHQTEASGLQIDKINIDNFVRFRATNNSVEFILTPDLRQDIITFTNFCYENSNAKGTQTLPLDLVIQIFTLKKQTQ